MFRQLLFLFQKMLHRNRLGTLYCHEGDWSWIYFFNGQCADAAGTALWQWQSPATGPVVIFDHNPF